MYLSCFDAGQFQWLLHSIMGTCRSDRWATVIFATTICGHSQIMMEELSTLATGFEVDGGQLRHQLYIWLERCVAALKELCQYGAAMQAPGSSSGVALQLFFYSELSEKTLCPYEIVLCCYFLQSSHSACCSFFNCNCFIVNFL